MSQRRCFLCGQKIRPGAGYRLGKHGKSGRITESHLFHNAACANVFGDCTGRGESIPEIV